MSRPNRDLCIMACVFCRDRLFQGWAREQGMLNATEHDAKQFILRVCGVESRNDLDRNEKAAAMFHQRIREPFLAWKDGRHGA